MSSEYTPTATEVPDLYVHVPKTGGTSLQTAVMSTYGARFTYAYEVKGGRLVRADRRLVRRESPRYMALEAVIKHIPPLLLRAGVQVGTEVLATREDEAFQKAGAIIGHFTVDTFNHVAGIERARLFTVVRDPLRRMVSHYRYLQQQKAYPPGLRGWMEGHDPTLPFADFALHESVQNFQVGYTGTDPTRFAALGTTETFGGFLMRAGLVQADCLVPHDNRTMWRQRFDDSCLNDPGFLREFERFHAKDYAFYSAASEI